MYYEYKEIWIRRNNEHAECYKVFQRYEDGFYAVQSKDSYRLNKISEQISSFDYQKVLLFIETDIEERGIFKPSITEAIDSFDNSF